MSVRFVQGDIFETQPQVALAHGCNCAGAMGKGIAVEFKRRWPEMYAIYKRMCDRGEFGCGDVFAWKDVASGRTIFNLGTQKTWKTKATSEAISSSLKKAVNTAEESSIAVVCMPLIGAGLGGLDANVVRDLILEIAGPSAVSFVVCAEYAAGISPIAKHDV